MSNKLPLFKAAIFCMAIGAMGQGSLTPPGAPSTTMKTLQQIEPRTPISTLPFTINRPGSYYLISNLTSAGHGVIITTNNVSLDLMGFTLAGSGHSNGVYVDGDGSTPCRNVTVRNGFIHNFGNGIRFEYALDSQAQGLHVSNNGAEGIIFIGDAGPCNGNTIGNCVIMEDSVGIRLQGTLVAGSCKGNRVISCLLRGNKLYGITVHSASANVVDGNTVIGPPTGVSGGIYVTLSSTNLILRNICIEHTFNYYFEAGNTYGPIVTATGALATTGVDAHPWANFSR